MKYHKLLLFLPTIIILSCNYNVEDKTSSNIQEATIATLATKDKMDGDLLNITNCKDVHTSQESEAETLILLDILRTYKFEKKLVPVNGHDISTYHNQPKTFMVSKKDLIALLDLIPVGKDQGLFIGYELKKEEKKSNSYFKFSNSCLNIYGAEIKNSTARVIDSSFRHFYLGSGCDSSYQNHVRERNLELATKHWGFTDSSNKFGVVYNAKCLLEAISGFNEDSVYIDIAVKIPNNDPLRFKEAYTTIVFSDQISLRDSILKKQITQDYIAKLNKKDSIESILQDIYPKVLFPLAKYADNGASCCPI